jgi:hypothetical protein
MVFVSDVKSDEKIDSDRSARLTSPIQRSSKMKGSGTRRKITAFAIILLVLLIAVLAWSAMRSVDDQANSNAAVNTKEYQAVFLTNGQVYFGKLQNIGSNYLVLTNIYYLQVQDSVQPTTVTASTDSSTNQAQLVKLGNELHGPEDKMEISSKQVLFWENLKADGKVSQSISKYKQ